MDLVADLPLFYADFGTDAVVNGDAAHPVRGLFDDAYADALGMVAGTHTVFMCASASAVAKGSTLHINGVDYRVKAGQPDGPGQTIWPLEKL